MKRYILKVELDQVTPSVWRRFIVPAHISLDRLHDVIQIVMGWHDYHLYEFDIGTKIYTEGPESKDDGLEAGRYTLQELAKRKGRTISYRYDFGDNWTHTVTLEQVIGEDQFVNELSKEEEFKLFRIPLMCMDGQKACPPEDVGGIFGYQEFCEAISNPDHERHKEFADWYESVDFFAKPFEIDRFNKDRVNAELNKYLRWSRGRMRAF